MQILKLAALLVLLLPLKLLAQRHLRAFEARDSVGKSVSIEAKVINVEVNPKTNIVHIGLSDWRNKEEMVTLLIRLKKMSEAKRSYYKGLLDKVVTFKGKVEDINGKTVVNSTDGKIHIEQVVYVDVF